MNRIEVNQDPKNGRVILRELDNQHVLGEIWIEREQLPQLLQQLQTCQPRPVQ